MAISRVRSAGPADEADVIGVITRAFETDPMARWSLPDLATYRGNMPLVALAFGGNGFATGSVHVVEGGLGAAMWLPPGVEPDVERLQALFGENTPDTIQSEMTAVFEQMSGYHPQEPHWYLPLIGIDPAHQGMGLGTALMRHALRQPDEQGLPAYLESSNPRNIPLYRRFGFEPLGAIQVGSSPTLVPMLRRPQTLARE